MSVAGLDYLEKPLEGRDGAVHEGYWSQSAWGELRGHERARIDLAHSPSTVPIPKCAEHQY